MSLTHEAGLTQLFIVQIYRGAGRWENTFWTDGANSYCAAKPVNKDAAHAALLAARDYWPVFDFRIHPASEGL